MLWQCCEEVGENGITIVEWIIHVHSPWLDTSRNFVVCVSGALRELLKCRDNEIET